MVFGTLACSINAAACNRRKIVTILSIQLIEEFYFIMDDRYLIRPALEKEVDALARMRMSLQAHMMKSNPNLFDLSKKRISALADNYLKEFKKDTSRVLVVHDTKTNRIIGMGMGRIFAHDEYIPNKSGRIDDV